MFYVLYFEYVIKEIFNKNDSMNKILKYKCLHKKYIGIYASIIFDEYKDFSDFPRAVFVKIGRKMSQDDLYYTENNEYVILYKKKMN